MNRILLLAAAFAVFGLGHSQGRAVDQAGDVGFRDELNDLSQWKPYNQTNNAKMVAPRRGQMMLTLPHVIYGWPYAYQWSGVRRSISVDVAHFPVLKVNVPEIARGSYAHFEIDVLDGADHKVKGLRSSTLVEPGVAELDLSSGLDPAIYHMELRLIVGGDNAGCSATYDWVRAYAKSNPLSR